MQVRRRLEPLAAVLGGALVAALLFASPAAADHDHAAQKNRSTQAAHHDGSAHHQGSGSAGAKSATHRGPHGHRKAQKAHSPHKPNKAQKTHKANAKTVAARA